MEGVDGVLVNALTTKSRENEDFLTIAAIGSSARKRQLKLESCFDSIAKIKLVRKPGKHIVVTTFKRTNQFWWRLLDDDNGSFRDFMAQTLGVYTFVSN